eukprot:scaffold117_cov148-Amphora_coffeaeformis.AAC.2
MIVRLRVSRAEPIFCVRIGRNMHNAYGMVDLLVEIYFLGEHARNAHEKVSAWGICPWSMVEPWEPWSNLGTSFLTQMTWIKELWSTMQYPFSTISEMTLV